MSNNYLRPYRAGVSFTFSALLSRILESSCCMNCWWSLLLIVRRTWYSLLVLDRQSMLLDRGCILQGDPLGQTRTQSLDHRIQLRIRNPIQRSAEDATVSSTISVLPGDMRGSQRTRLYPRNWFNFLSLVECRQSCGDSSCQSGDIPGFNWNVGGGLSLYCRFIPGIDKGR